MCILFIYTGGEEGRGYRLILASNRDESYKRPASPAAPWSEDEEVIGGRDMEPGREGGTWLAASPLRRRIAALLNLPDAPSPPDAKGRGFIVADFVKSDETAAEHFEKHHSRRNEYSPFNLVTVEVGDRSSNVSFYSNFDGKMRSYSDNFLAFGNSLPETPLRKTTAGGRRFREALSAKLSNNSDKDEIIRELLSLLKWNHPHLPDEVLEKRKTFSKEVSAVFVDMPQSGYGTRTHTIILIDHEGCMDFIEWTKVPNQEEWLKTHLQRKL